ncbi:hypothetical protein DPMN_135586 [Dreissena polymorpha]|uniref:Uncharacterized protein n=1 Tax=Dreissena polymorpha TaxID=45954 RepID=A0A9D4G1V1_DREPO|nr:hypothetical protein DPMN_135586 [Dreissena polymorpha]
MNFSKHFLGETPKPHQQEGETNSCTYPPTSSFAARSGGSSPYPFPSTDDALGASKKSRGKHFEYNIFYDLQRGFRDRRFCETQLIQLVDDLARNLDAGQQSDLIPLDFG